MKPKTAITAVLLVFVAASIVYLVVKETGSRDPRAADNEPRSGSVVSSTTNAPTGQVKATGRKVVT